MDMPDAPLTVTMLEQHGLPKLSVNMQLFSFQASSPSSNRHKHVQPRLHNDSLMASCQVTANAANATVVSLED